MQKGADCRSRINMPQARTDTTSGVNRTSRKRSKKQTMGHLGQRSVPVPQVPVPQVPRVETRAAVEVGRSESELNFKKLNL